MSDNRVYCADLCLASGEPMLGTAVEVDVWLLLEYKPAWRPKALEDNDLSARTRDWLDRTLAAVAESGRKIRAQFIRRPEIDTDETTLFIAEEGTLKRFHSHGYDDVHGLSLDSPDFEEVPQAHYFVCTNGQRDLCCARYGLPAYAQLRALAGNRTWQTTHLGGHRFAPNVLVLPQGAIYGRVFPDEVADFVETIETGALSRNHLRGRSAYSPEAQVAEAHLDGVRRLRSVDGGKVTFETEGGIATVDIQPAATPLEVIASCGKTEPEAVFPLQPAGRPRRETA
ncbi:MAG: hypothetical protein OXH68_17700 [Gammaproteobacteria bacterium]|nr:hypothetical protein [Gammaproteobacteria bacterium]